jgi:hypothetical protein
MDIEVWKVVGATVLGALSLAAAAPGARKAWGEVQRALWSRRQSESDFARKLAEAMKSPEIARHADELGVAALVGDRHLSHRQRMRLLSVPGSEQVIELYMQSRDSVEVVDGDEALSTEVLRWKSERLSKHRYRTAVRAAWVAAYLVSAVLAFSPSLVWNFIYPDLAMPGPVRGLQAVTAVLLLSFAIYCLNSGSKITVAERLMNLVDRGLTRLPERAPTKLPDLTVQPAKSAISLAGGTAQGQGKAASTPPAVRVAAAVDARSKAARRRSPQSKQR